MEIPLNASLGNNRDGAPAGPNSEGGGGSGSRPDATYREALDDVLRQVKGERDYDRAYTTFSIAARPLLKLGMPVELMLEYQDRLADLFAKRNEPVAPIQTIDQYINIQNSNGPLKGNVSQQQIQLTPPPTTPTPDDPKLLE